MIFVSLMNMQKKDMIMMAFKDASKKVDSDKEKKLGKYGQGSAGLM